jgi:hypothetical protein
MATALATASVFVAVGASFPTPAARPAERWQYGELHYRHLPERATRKGGPNLPPETTVRWITAGGEVRSDGWEGMAAKLKASVVNKDVPEESRKLRVFDRLGEEGWELTGQPPDLSKDMGLGATYVWTFKRKVR